MRKLTIEQEMELQYKLTNEIWDKYNARVEFRFNEKIVTSDDEILTVLQVIFFKDEVGNSKKLFIDLINLFAENGLYHIRLDKDVWLSDRIRYILNFL